MSKMRYNKLEMRVFVSILVIASLILGAIVALHELGVI